MIQDAHGMWNRASQGVYRMRTESRVSIRPRGRDRVPASVTGLFIISREFVPVRPCNSIQIVDHFSFSKRQLASELLRSSQPSPMHVYEAESAFLEPQYGDVGHGARRQMPQFLALDLSGRIPRGTKNHVVNRHPHRQKLVHHIEHVFHPGVHAPDVEIGGNGIGNEALFHRRHGDPPQKAAASMSHVKDHSALSAFPKRGIHFARFDPLVAKPRIKVGVDVARPELPRHEFTQRTLSVIDSKVDHDGDIRQRTCLDGAFNRRPFRAGVVGRLDAYDQALMAKRHFSRRPGFHVRKVLLKLSAPHAIADNIDERQHTGLGTIDDPLLEVLEISPARASGVGDRGDSRPESEAVGINAIITSVRASFARPRKNVNMTVNEPGRYVISRNVHHFEGLSGIDLSRHCDYFSVCNGDITNYAYLVFGIDDMAAL